VRAPRPLLVGLRADCVLDPNQMPMAAHTAGSAPALLLLLAPCQNGTMPRIDRYDIIGIVLVVFVVALWVLHFSLPPQPPLVVVP
jgi:hypothetical protein